MLRPPLEIHVAWNRRETEPAVRARVEAELRALAWTLSQMQALLYDAHCAASLEHAFLLPRIELRLPLFDLHRRYRVTLSYVAEKPHIALVDEDDRPVAELVLCG